MKTKKMGLLLALAIGLEGLLGSANVYAARAESPYELNVNGSFVPMDVQPLETDSTLLIPIRTLSSLGLIYDWHASEKSLTVRHPSGDVLTISLNSPKATKNNQAVKLSVPAQSKNGRVMVPLRFISENLGDRVQYEPIRKMIFVNSADYQFDPKSLNPHDLVKARRAAISLPITTDFKTLPFGTKTDHSYLFPAGRADSYIFGDGETHTIVNITGGKAQALGQYIESDRANLFAIAGAMTMKTLADPLLQPFVPGDTFYHRAGSAHIEATYWTGDVLSPAATMKSLDFSTYHIYSDIIQDIPQER
ncbi:hypothetical protein B9G55_14705 [Saccharibacillus sp. O16]|nr:hypothetical protein B9G55_14705 [Saccharibacillus sp. O16]